jgi:hypothetical protein
MKWEEVRNENGVMCKYQCNQLIIMNNVDEK